jgi:hypothetical protein
MAVSIAFLHEKAGESLQNLILLKKYAKDFTRDQTRDL